MAGRGFPSAPTGIPGWGLKAGHGRAGVVQDHHDDIGLVVDGVHQARHGGMEKGRVPAADRYDRLIHAKTLELAESGSHTHARSHGGNGFHGPGIRSPDTPRV